MNHWVSYFLVLSLLRLQFVFCNCGAVGHFEDSNQHSPSHECCSCNSVDASEHTGTESGDSRIVDSHSDKSQPTVGPDLICQCCVDCDQQRPFQRHVHSSQPRIVSDSRLHAEMMAPLNSWPPDLHICVECRQGKLRRFDLHPTQLILQDLIGQLRI